MRTIGKILMGFILVADLWFAWNTRALFYTDEMAFSQAESGMDLWSPDELKGLGTEVRYDGLTFLGRVKRWPAIYDRMYTSYPIRSFFWQYQDGNEIRTLHIGLSSNGRSFGRAGYPAELFEEYPLYEH